MLTFAHLSDIHLAPLPPVPAAALLGKRLTGYLSWQLKRSRVHRPDVLARLIEDMRGLNPDHFCVTGDLVNIALPAEIDHATAWLAKLAPADRISLVPGNHDAYTRGSLREATAQWKPWTGDSYPFVQRRSDVAFIGLSTAVVTPPFFASGRLGRDQLGRLEAILADLARENLQRVVLLHHPPQPDATVPRKALDDAAAFRAVIARTGAELILHGHLHRPVEAWLEGPRGKVPVFGAGSASLSDPVNDHQAHYYMFTLDDGRIGTRSRRYDPATRTFIETARILELN